MYCLIQLYVPVAKDLARHKPLLKLFAVKAVGSYLCKPDYCDYELTPKISFSDILASNLSQCPKYVWSSQRCKFSPMILNCPIVLTAFPRPNT